MNLFLVSGEIRFQSRTTDFGYRFPENSDEFPNEFDLDLEDDLSPMSLHLKRTSIDNRVPLLSMKNGKVVKYSLKQDEVQG